MMYLQKNKPVAHPARGLRSGQALACAKARVIRSSAAQLRYALRYAFPTN